MRAARLLSILLLLQMHSRLTAGVLARRLEVSERTIYRDMEALSAAGVPVFAERGQGGGWSLLEEYRTNLTGLSEAEIRPLFLAEPAQLLVDLGWRQDSEAAVIKLLAALPGAHRRDAEFVRRRIHIDVSGWRGDKEDVSFLPTLQAAIWQERKVRLTYQRADGAAVERLVDPLGLVAKGRVWYLAAAVDGDIRTYRVSRVQGAEIAELPCRRPDSFDLAAYWEESKARFTAELPRYPATVRVAPSILSQLRYPGWFARIEHVAEPDATGWRQAAIRFQSLEEAAAYVLSFGPNIEVVEPAELREQVIRTAEEVTAFYAERAS